MVILLSVSLYCWLLVGFALVLFKFILDKILLVQKAFATIRDYPGREIVWINPLVPLSVVLGTFFPRPGMTGYWASRFSLYNKFGATSYASVGIFSARKYFWLADAEAIKLVASNRHTFEKDVVAYEVLNFYGGNIVTTGGSDWKRYRSLTMSAFNEANVALVWSETFHVIEKWFEQLDAADPDATVDLLHSITQATLLIITAAGFGKRIAWTTDSTTEPPPGCKLTFQSAIVDSIENIMFRGLTPEWFYRLSSFIKVPYLSSRALLTRLAFDDLRTHLLDLVVSARTDVGSASGEHNVDSRVALLRNLVEANLKQDGDSKRLTEGELLSNMFAYILAGHASTTHALCFTLVLLALHPECQQKIYEEVNHVWHTDVSQIMTNHKEYMDKLEYTMACIREALRMYPVAPRLTKDVHADTAVHGTYFTNGSKNISVETGKFSMAVPAGSTVIMDIWAVHMNPLYWGNDAAEFKPERFIDTESYQWPRHAYLSFSVGTRSCPGQRFAYAQMVGILASIVRRYQVVVPDDLANKPFEVQREMLLKWKTDTTLTPTNAHVKFCRRGGHKLTSIV